MRLAETTTGPIQGKWVPGSDSVLDKPFLIGNLGELPITRAFGQVMSIPQLAQAKADSKPDAVMVRANNLGAVVAQILLKLPADTAIRERALEEFGGLAWTQSVLSTARNFPGATGIADAVRTSLVLHFLLGIADSEAGKVSMYGEAYQRTVKYVRSVERQKKEKAAKSSLGGIEGLGQRLPARTAPTPASSGARNTAVDTRIRPGVTITFTPAMQALLARSIECQPMPASTVRADKAYTYTGRSGSKYNIPADCARFLATSPLDLRAGDEFGPQCGTTKYEPYNPTLPNPAGFDFVLPVRRAYHAPMVDKDEGVVQSQTALMLGDDGAVYIAMGNTIIWHNGIGRPILGVFGPATNVDSFPERYRLITDMPRVNAGLYRNLGSFLGIDSTAEVAPAVAGIDRNSLRLVRAANTKVLTLLGKRTGSSTELTLWTSSSTRALPTFKSLSGTIQHKNPFDNSIVDFDCDGTLRLRDLGSGSVLWSAKNDQGFLPNPQWLSKIVQPGEKANAKVGEWYSSGAIQQQGLEAPKYATGEYVGFLYDKMMTKAKGDWGQIINDSGCAGNPTKKQKVYNTIGAFRSIFHRHPTIDELVYYLNMSWCTNGVKMDPYAYGSVGAGEDTMRGVMRRIRDAVPYQGTMPNPQGCTEISATCLVTNKDFADRGIGGFFAALGEATSSALDNVAGAVTDVLCGAFKSLFGETVGGVFCAVFSAVVRFFASGIAAAAAILGTVVTSIVRFIQILATGKDETGKNYDAEPGGRVLGGVFALLSAVTEIIFLLTAPIAVPLLFATDPTKKDAISSGIKELKDLAKKVAQKNPLFPLIVILAVISAVMTPTPASITGLIVALIPMAAIILAKILKQGNPATGQPAIPLFANVPLDSTPTTKGLIDMTEQLLKALVILIQGLSTIGEMVDKFMTQLDTWMKKNPDKSAFFPKGDPNKTVAQNISAFATNLKNRIQSIFNALKDIMRTGLSDLTATATNLLVLVPIIILAIFEPAVSADATLKQTIDKWITDAQTAGQQQTQYADQLNQSAKDLIELLTLPEQAALLQEEARKQGITEAGTLVGQQLAQRMKASTIPQADKTRFITAARAAYGPVN